MEYAFEIIEKVMKDGELTEYKQILLKKVNKNAK